MFVNKGRRKGDWLDDRGEKNDGGKRFCLFSQTVLVKSDKSDRVTG